MQGQGKPPHIDSFGLPLLPSHGPTAYLLGTLPVIYETKFALTVPEPIRPAPLQDEQDPTAVAFLSSRDAFTQLSEEEESARRAVHASS